MINNQSNTQRLAVASRMFAFGALVAVCLVLFFYVLGLETMSPKFIALQSPEDLLEDEYLMEDILEMVENPSLLRETSKRLSKFVCFTISGL